MRRPELHRPRIRSQAYNLRDTLQKDWAKVDANRLLERIKEEQRTGEDQWQIVPWQRGQDHRPARSYLAMSQGGGLYAIFISTIA